ncbi:helix-turn-helix domain-containing protein [Bermanella sp. R86510]|uniref:helix-turn-helix domain-containing protein n=1 Tax=unclassified Bermanella TaxID=2627862 RepID=UPI0037C92982
MKKTEWEAKFNTTSRSNPASKERRKEPHWLAIIGDTLSQERKRRKLSQTDIANTLDINRSIISKIENGNHTGSLKPVIKYVDYLKLTLTAQPIQTGLPQVGDNSMFEEPEGD